MDIDTLRHHIREEVVRWEELLYLANIHFCTPLLYVCLRRDGLLGLLPAELREFLAALYELNVERNAFFIEALRDLQTRFTEDMIPSILLKGGAAFCDDLYGDPGARILQDIDLLVKPQDAGQALAILADAGYEEVVDPGHAFEGLPMDSRHHHFNPRKKPGSPVVVEIHYKIAYARAGELLGVTEAWQHSEEIIFNGRKFRLLGPLDRLIHNAAHALISEADFIRGTISLRQLAEFSFLSQKYGDAVSWQGWLEKAATKGYVTEFITYFTLAHRLMKMPLPDGFHSSWRANLHAERISVVWHSYAIHESFPQTGWRRIRGIPLRFMAKLYYFLNLPMYVWQNVCYTENNGNILLRIGYLLKKAASARSRARI